MTTTRFILSLFICFLCASLLIGAVDVTGKWNMTSDTRQGQRTREVEFIQDGESLKVISQGRDGQEIESEGTVKDNDIEWTMTRETPRGTFSITYKGKIDGDSMTGTAQFGSRGSRDWTAERVK